MKFFRLPTAKFRAHIGAVLSLCCFAGAGLIAAPYPARADVFEISPGGSVTAYRTPGVYTAENFQPIVSPRAGGIPLRLPTPQIGALLGAASRRYAVDRNLLDAVAWKESRFHHDAVSPRGAVGVMQLMPATALALGVDRYDTFQNILGGAAYLRQMLDRYRDVPLALAAYNAGPQAVDRHRGIPPFRETQDYVRAITDVISRPIYSPPPSVLIIDR